MASDFEVLYAKDIAVSRAQGLAKGQPKWLRPSTLATEVKAALRRTKLEYKGIPKRTLALWRLSDPRPTPIHFYDGTIDHKRLALMGLRRAIERWEVDMPNAPALTRAEEPRL